MYIVYDCEIINCIPPKDGELDPSLNYCLGWDDFEGMGISVVGVAVVQPHYASYRSYVLDPKVNPNAFGDYFDLRSLLSYETVIGFNSESFDDNLIATNGILGKLESRIKSRDLLKAIRLAAFGSDRWQDTPRGYSYGLDKIAKVNGLGSKTGSGELAPKLWQKGQYQEVIDYCINDVALTVQILDLAMEGELIDPNNGKVLESIEPHLFKSAF